MALLLLGQLWDELKTSARSDVTMGLWKTCLRASQLKYNRTRLEVALLLYFSLGNNLTAKREKQSMRANFSIRFAAVPAIIVAIAQVAIVLMISGRAEAQSLTVLHSFNSNGSDGSYPYGGVIFDAKGSLYGTTVEGGRYDLGIAFELLPATGEKWKERVLHSFGGGSDGASPNAALTVDSSGNLYGTTFSGGNAGVGSVFELTLKASGEWKETVLLNFGSGSAAYPAAPLIMDAAGNLYGTTVGYNLDGAVFELVKVNGAWTEQDLHIFDYSQGDGGQPYAPVVLDAKGNLYGTTKIGPGPEYDDGIVFQLVPNQTGPWTENVLEEFVGGVAGFTPYAGVVLDTAGNLYGANYDGGQGKGGGTVFKLTPEPDGRRTKETVLHSFPKTYLDGANPAFAPVFDGKGNLYGTTSIGGSGACTEFGVVVGCGVVYELSPAAGGWTETILYSFDNNGTDPYFPSSGLNLDVVGNLYGTTSAGGAYGAGSVFEIRR
jgi:hypothetical protein